MVYFCNATKQRKSRYGHLCQKQGTYTGMIPNYRGSSYYKIKDKLKKETLKILIIFVLKV